MGYFVHSGLINAWSLDKGLRKLGLQLSCLAEQSYFLDCATEKPAAGDTIFFTEEHSLGEFLNKPKFQYWPRHFQLPLDDKLAFYGWLESRGEHPVPFNADPHRLPAKYPVLLKARHSWLEARKLPQGYVCNSSSELNGHLKQIDALGLPRDCFLFQNMIPGRSINYSTCGFFDHENPGRNIIKVARRVVAAAKSLGSSAIVETLPDPEELIARTRQILTALQFAGPFELEFLYDSRANRYWVLELNPRFWLQHGLFIDVFDNIVIRNYLGLADERECHAQQTSTRQAVWCDRLGLVRNLPGCNVPLMRAYARATAQARRSGAAVCWYPDWPAACRAVVGRFHKSAPPSQPTKRTDAA